MENLPETWVTRLPGLVVPGTDVYEGYLPVHPRPPACPPGFWRDAKRLSEDRELLPTPSEATPPPPQERSADENAIERLAIVKRGQLLGFGALVLMLIAIVTLAAIGQPWVAGTVATAGLAVVVAIFVTGQCQPPAN